MLLEATVTSAEAARGRAFIDPNMAGRSPGLRSCFSVRPSFQWWRNGSIGGQSIALHKHHLWRPSTSENNFLSRNLVEPVADARLCCARASAHRHVAPRRPRSELFTWQRLRCPKARKVRASGSEVKDGGGYDHPLTHGPVFQRDKRIIESLIPGFGDSSPPEVPSRGRYTRNPVSIIAVLELTSPDRPRPPADDLLPR